MYTLLAGCAAVNIRYKQSRSTSGLIFFISVPYEMNSTQHKPPQPLTHPPVPPFHPHIPSLPFSLTNLNLTVAFVTENAATAMIKAPVCVLYGAN